MSDNFRNLLNPRRIFRTIVVGICILMLAGCFKQLLVVGLLLGGRPSIEPDFEKTTKQSLSDYGVKVAVVCDAPKEVEFDNTGIAKDIARFVSHRLNQHKIRVINPDAVNAWLDKNPDWGTEEEIGEAFEVTHIVHIDIKSFSLYAPGSSDLYQGRTEAEISVTEMKKDGSGEIIYTKDLSLIFPQGSKVRSTHDTSFTKFKAEFLAFLSVQIGWKFYEHENLDKLGYFD